jgi:hypothetical protein
VGERLGTSVGVKLGRSVGNPDGRVLGSIDGEGAGISVGGLVMVGLTVGTKSMVPESDMQNVTVSEPVPLTAWVFGSLTIPRSAHPSFERLECPEGLESIILKTKQVFAGKHAKNTSLKLPVATVPVLMVVPDESS